MATAVSSPRPLAPPASRDRAFYSGVAVLMLVTALVGFGRTYYFSALSGVHGTITGRAFTGTLRLHAVLFTAWLLLFIVQTALVATHRVAVHRRLGIAGAVLAAAMIAVGLSTAAEAARAGSAPPGVDSYAFLAVPLGDLTFFTGFLALALVWRNHKETHKRLMILASASLMTAALARWPGVLPLGPLAFYGLTLLFPIVGIVYDRLARGRVHRVYWWGLAAMVLGVALRLLLIGSPAWQHAMRSLLS